MDCKTTCCEGLKKIDVDNWTDSLSKLLTCQNGRKKFMTFLSDRSLKEAERTVIFWEMCYRAKKIIQNSNKSYMATNELKEDLRELVNYADKYVELLPTQMKDLSQILEEKEHDKIYYTLSRAESSAICLLEEEHRIFSAIILKEFIDNSLK